MSVDTTAPGPRQVVSPRATAAVLVSVLVLATTLTWTFFSMRAVMGVGGSCAEGGPYVSSQSCPGGSWLIAVAVPVMLLTAMLGTAAAASVGAPNLLLPMWGLLFGSLGWNFLEFAFKGGEVVVGWLVCGVMFWLMAAPAVYAVLVGVKVAVLPPDPSRAGGARWWVPAYAALLSLGFLLGAWSFDALS